MIGKRTQSQPLETIMSGDDYDGGAEAQSCRAGAKSTRCPSNRTWSRSVIASPIEVCSMAAYGIEHGLRAVGRPSDASTVLCKLSLCAAIAPQDHCHGAPRPKGAAAGL